MGLGLTSILQLFFTIHIIIWESIYRNLKGIRKEGCGNIKWFFRIASIESMSQLTRLKTSVSYY